jgi:hypothetical protein
VLQEAGGVIVDKASGKPNAVLVVSVIWCIGNMVHRYA